MIGVVFVRRLREGKSYDDFRAAWAVIESTEVRTFFVVDGDHDFQAAPHPVAGSAKGYPWVTPAR